jgi:hypothetical protein
VSHDSFSLVLFLHVLSALLMFGALAVEAVALDRMRGANSQLGREMM